MITTTSLMRAKIAITASAIALSALSHPSPAAAPPPIASPRTVSTGVELAATVTADGSAQTVGVADAYLYALDQTQLVAQLNEIQSLGVTDLRIVVPWVYIQPTSATSYDWSKMDNVINTARSMGFTLTAAITGNPTWDGTPLVGAPNPNTYATFAAAVAKRYSSQIAAYEVWNEPNALTYLAPSDPAAYTAMLKAAYTAIKAVQPSATVIAGVLGAVTTVPGISLAPQQFLAGMYAAGAQGFFDALSFHPYNYTLPFSAGSGVTNSPLEQVQAMYALMVANGDSALKIIATEYGNPTQPGGITQTQQAQMLQDFITAWSKLPFAGTAFIYTANDLNSGYLLDENNMGLWSDAGIPKLAAQTLATLISQLATGTLPAYTAPQMSAAQTIWIQSVSLGISVINEALLIPNIMTQMLYNAAPAPLQQAFSAAARAVSLSVGNALNAITPAAETAIGLLTTFPTTVNAAATTLGTNFYNTELTVQGALAAIGIGAGATPTAAATHATSATATAAPAAATPAKAAPTDSASPTATPKPVTTGTSTTATATGTTAPETPTASSTAPLATPTTTTGTATPADNPTAATTPTPTKLTTAAKAAATMPTKTTTTPTATKAAATATTSKTTETADTNTAKHPSRNNSEPNNPNKPTGAATGAIANAHATSEGANPAGALTAARSHPTSSPARD